MKRNIFARGTGQGKSRCNPSGNFASLTGGLRRRMNAENGIHAAQKSDRGELYVNGPTRSL
jgi:hypothetical protein